MATSFGTTASAAAAPSSVANNSSKSSAYLPNCRRHFSGSSSKVTFRINSKPKLRFSTKVLRPICTRPALARAQLNEVASDESSNASASSAVKTEVPPAESNDVKTSSHPTPAIIASEESVSAFMTQVADLVKLVDSKDIVELQLKQLDCEVLIRKKEALPPPPSPAPSMIIPSHLAPPVVPSPPPAVPSPAPAPAPAPVSPSTPKSVPSAPKSPTSSHPPLKSPMAGTFYRSPAPGEPPFVKIGDKVKKGQVLCIIEAMKLMNEIEADQSGTVVEVVAEDGKPVSLDSPLFVIAP